jgi:hypothetical protein
MKVVWSFRLTTIIGTWSLGGIAEPLGCRLISADKLQNIPASAVLESNSRSHERRRAYTVLLEKSTRTSLDRRFGGQNGVCVIISYS